MGPRWGEINLSTDPGCSSEENSVSCFEIIFPHLLRVAQLKKACEMANKKRPGGGFPAHLRGRLKILTGATGPATSGSALVAATSAPPSIFEAPTHPVFLAAYLSDDKAKVTANA